MKPAFKRILIAVDTSRCATCAVRVGNLMAAQTGVEVLIVHVVNRPGAEGGGASESHARILAGLRRKGRALLRKMCAVSGAGAAAAGALREGVPTEEILSAAAEWGAELIVLGAYGHTRLAGLILGGTAEAVARRARCPVMTVGDAPRAPQGPVHRPRSGMAAR